MKYLSYLPLLGIFLCLDFAKKIPFEPVKADLPDLAITEIDAGNYKLSHGYVPVTYTITNKGTEALNLKDVRIDASWVKQGSEEILAISVYRDLVLKYSGLESKVLEPNKSFEVTLDALVPDRMYRPQGVYLVPAQPFNPRGIIDLYLKIDPLNRVRESREHNNTARVPVDFNVRDHRN